jgi:uncharacterized protein
MISHDELLQTNRENILRIAAKYGAYNVRIFGSVARGEADSESDIDLLVNMEPGRSLLDLCGLLIDLEELLGHKVDVVTEKGLRDRIRERVLKEAVALSGTRAATRTRWQTSGATRPPAYASYGSGKNQPTVDSAGSAVSSITDSTLLQTVSVNEARRSLAKWQWTAWGR